MPVASSLFGVLGPLEVRTGDRPVRPSSARRRLLLAVLLAEANRLVSADRLIEELWGDALPTDPPAALRTQISRLRRILGPAAEVLGTEAGGYRLRVEPGQLDANRFEELAGRAREADGEAALELMDAALALWRGRAFEDFGDRPFAQGAAVRLEELRTALIEDRARALLSSGRADEAVAAMEELLASYPERERARALLMRALYSQGRHADALECYRAWRRLADDLGLEPSPELAQLEREILTHAIEPPPTAPAIPLPASSFVGRHRDLEAVASLLGRERLVTLCGPGGVGKTRLALEITRRVRDRYRDGVRLCDLVAVRRPTSVGRAIATAVGVSERGHRRIEEQVIEHLSGRRVLVIIDNCEHVLAAASAMARSLIEGTEGADVLATSRERLGVSGEHVWSVAPLDASGPGAPAVQLFCDRARAVDPTFTAGDRDLIGSICARLDGLPLAIELAAGRLPGLTPSELAERLDQRLRLLVQDGRTEARHRSLRAVIDWSYDRMSPSEQRVFERLGIFAGRFDLDAALAVVGSGKEKTADDVTETLLSFIDRSVVVAHREGDATRYALLDSLRTYAVEKLAERGELDAARDRHGRWALELAERAAAGMTGADEPAWARKLDDHFDDLRAAHAWLVGRDADLALRLTSTLHWFALWYSKSEVFRWAEVSASAAVGGDPALLSATLGSAAQGACQRGAFGDAQEYALAALDAGRESDACQRRRATGALAEVCLLTGELDRAAALFREAYELSWREGDILEAIWEIGSVALSYAYSGRADAARAAAAETTKVAEGSDSPSVRGFAEYVVGEVAADSDPDRARKHLAEASRLATSAGSHLIAGLADATLASLIARHDDPVSALDYYETVIVRWRETSAWMPLSVTLRSLVELLTRLRASEDAAVLYGAVYSGRTGARPFGQDEEILRAASVQLREELGDADFAERVEEGGALGIDQVVERALDALKHARDAANAPGERRRHVQTVKTFMFTDIVASTDLAQAMGDDAWDSILRWHDATLRSSFARFGGEELKHTGDGFLVAFEDPRSAVECAVEIQRRLASHRRDHGYAPDMRIALNTAAATRRGSDFTGTGVNIAARIRSLAEGGQILASADTLTGISDLRLSQPRAARLKGVRGLVPVPVVIIEWS